MKKAALLTLLAIGLCACGIKPDNTEPPEEVKAKEFPRTYPSVLTDPPPYVPPQ